MATVGEIIGQQVRLAIDEALSDSQGLLDNMAQVGGDTAAQGMVGDIGSMFGFLAKVGLLGGVGGELLTGIAELLGHVDNEGGKLGRAFGIGYIGGYLMYQQLNPFFLPLTHAINDLTQNEIFDPDTAADLAARGIISGQFAGSEAAGGGMDGKHLEQLIASKEAWPQVQLLLDMFNRGFISQSQVNEALKRAGTPDEFIGPLSGLQQQLLSAPEIALARLRGDIDDATAATLAGLVGVDELTLNLLEGNTGEPPGTMQLLEAYRRGFIDTATLERGIRQSRVRNEWIPTIEKLRFSPMTVADSVRAVVENYITQAEGQKIAEDNGLEAQHYPILVESWGRPLAHMEMGSLVHRGLASMEQFNQAMRESDIKDKYIPQSFLTTQRLLPERLIVSALHYNAIDTTTAARLIMELGYNQEATAILLKTGLHEAAGTGHHLTRTEITTLYTDGIINRDQAVKQLEGLGLDAPTANYLIQIADISAHAKVLKQEETAIRSSFLANGIDRQQAETQLQGIGLSPAQAGSLLGAWDRERRRAARVLSESQVVKAAKQGTISPDQALALLEAGGYSQADARILLKSNGVSFG